MSKQIISPKDKFIREFSTAKNRPEFIRHLNNLLAYEKTSVWLGNNNQIEVIPTFTPGEKFPTGATIKGLKIEHIDIPPTNF